MKRIAALALTLALLAGGLSVRPAAAIDTDITLKVGLFYESTALPEAKLENVDTTGYRFGTYDGDNFVSDKAADNTQLTVKIVNDAFQVTDTASGTVLYTSKAGADHLAISPNSTLTWCKGYKWNGDFVYRKASNGNITVINYVGLQDYVKGVLPYEVNPDWPIEALKAQAVCARSFALGSLDKHASLGFNLCNTTNCQVYQGANKATAASDRAVDETAGEYLTYDGKLAVGYFFSSDGGATEDAVNVWGGDYPYLKGKADPYEDVENAYNGVWSVTLTAEQVQSKLRAKGYDIGAVASVAVTARTKTDNVNEVTVTDTAGKQVKISKDAVRSVFGLNSIRYQITPNTTATSKTAAISKTAAAPKIQPSTHLVTVDGNSTAPQGYNIDGNNYFKLRDIAYIVNNTDAQFDVSWDAAANEITLIKNQAYQAVGGELAAAEQAVVKNVSVSDVKILLDGKQLSLSGYRINGNNYYKVRDVSDAVGFTIGFDEASQTVQIVTKPAGETQPPETPDEPQKPVTNALSYTFDGTGWGHSVGMSQYGALGMAQQGFGYADILKFYYTGIEIQK